MDPTTTAMAEAMNQMARSTNWAWEQAYLGEKAAREALEKRITELEELLDDVMRANGLWSGR